MSRSYSHNHYRLADLRAALKPFRLHYFSTLRSTNDHAANLRRRRELFAPAIVLTSNQTAGRGRGANTWFSAQGSITATFVLPVDPTRAAHQLPLAAGLAVRNAVVALSGNHMISLKWPNDIIYSPTKSRAAPYRKLAGLLCERLEGVDLIGVGLNVNRARIPRALAGRIITLEELTGAAIDKTAALVELARRLHQVLVRKSETALATILAEYDQYHALVGRQIRVLHDGESPLVGRCEGLDSSGRLLLRNKLQLHRIVAGHIEWAQEGRQAQPGSESYSR